MTQNEIDFFDALAPDWDKNEVRSTPERINEILSVINIKRGDRVLDLGTGTGVLLPYLAERVGAEGHVTAIDISEGMLNIAKAKYGDLPQVDLLKLDFEEEAVPGSYDVILLYSVYPHLHRPFETIEWLLKINTNPGGRIFIAFPSDEKFINEIHHRRNSTSDHLPPASILTATLRRHAFNATILDDTPDSYLIQITRDKFLSE